MITRNPLPSEALGDFPARRWDQMRRDVADFLASPWAAEAARLGWTELALYGVDADPTLCPDRRVRPGGLSSSGTESRIERVILVQERCGRMPDAWPRPR